MIISLPIKRAELIGNLVQSISIIPEAIVRDVYIKECSQLLRIEDKLLVSEVAKRRETQAEKQAEQRNRETRKNNAARDAAQAPLPDGMQPPYPEDMPPYPMDGEMPDGGTPLPPEAAEYVSSFTFCWRSTDSKYFAWFGLDASRLVVASS